MKGTLAVLKRELAGYFATPLAYVFIVIFLVLAGAFTFQIGQLFATGQASLSPFFSFHPWLYLFLIPALSMRLWAEERKSGTLELLMTLPITTAGAVAGKFLAAWLFAGIALGLTFPAWVTVNYLGNPDNGAIVAAYAGSFLMAGSFLAIGSLVSSLTRSQVIAFVVSAVVGFGFLLAGFDPVLDVFRAWAPRTILESVASFSFLTRFESISRGVVELRDVLFFVSLIAACLVATGIAIDTRRA
ncbi:MAG: ABC transporter permease [Phycisphaerae bacterium]|nr:ABC transporter permease [Phycisphaerae bacterium]